MVLGPVELHAPGDPGPGKAHQPRLDHVVPVEEVVPGRLVEADVDAASDFRQQHEPQVFVLQVDRLPEPGLLRAGDAVNERHRVDLAAGPLVHAAVQEHRIPVRHAGSVGVDGDRLAPAGNAAGLQDGLLVRRRVGQMNVALEVVGVHHLFRLWTNAAAAHGRKVQLYGRSSSGAHRDHVTFSAPVAARQPWQAWQAMKGPQPWNR